MKNYTRRKILNKPCRTVRYPTIPADRRDVGEVPVDILPDDALLGIFDHYVHENSMKNLNRWTTLVHSSSVA
jgi:hypothetical protein